MNRGIKRLLYFGAVLALFALGIVVWLKNSGDVDGHTFIVKGEQEARFEFNSSIASPKKIVITLKGEIPCDGMLTLSATGTNVRTRRTFPVKQSKSGKMKFEANWTHSETAIEFRTNDCRVNYLEIEVEVMEKQ